MKKEYVFPEKWKILITKENFDIVTPYYSEVSSVYTILEVALNKYIGSHNHNNQQPFEETAKASFFKLYNEYKYTTITTEQFIEYVLNQRVYTSNKPKNYDYLIPMLKSKNII